MKTLEDYVTDRRLVGILCRKRIDHARKSRRTLFVSRAAGVHQTIRTEELVALLPPRRHWPRLLRKERATVSDLPRAKAKRLQEFVLKQLAHPRHDWTKRLRLFLDECQSRVGNWTETDTISPDRFVGMPKERPGSGKKYRVLAPYSLGDAIVDSVFASYLRDLVDARLDANCYAFRLPKGAAPVTHHDAVADLRRFAVDHPKNTLWVAECDIRGFFDSVAHDVTTRGLGALLAESSNPVDPRLLHFVSSFLRGYDYRGARNEAIAQLFGKRIVDPEIYDPNEALAKSGIRIRPSVRLGIPQGSSFSSVLANIVLTKADRAVRSAIREHRGTFYARYVDDIVIASTNRSVATRAMSAYRQALRESELPDHHPQSIDPHSDDMAQSYWGMKSKAPYPWTLPADEGIRWIGFLGYQMKRDGTLRVRRSSITKELAKQRKAIDDIVRLIDKSRVRAQQKGQAIHIPRLYRIRYAAMMHLVSIGVGYPSESRIWPAANAVCWASGFRLLRDGRRDLRLLKTLDRGRGIALRALQTRLRSLAALPGVKERKTERSAPKFVIKREGRPLSYYAQFSE